MAIVFGSPEARTIREADKARERAVWRGPEPRDCPECEGDGVTTCLHCNSEIECERCDSLGKIFDDDAQRDEWQSYQKALSESERGALAVARLKIAS